ncbi:hypothetical protein PIB30_009831 [Stylosanthes scabra]|uniref:NAC domain-containing protein n=1 Tax=Stylosanthes scabra TaxID=79078 RepID=A0ABU6Q579_9FABA|nr:hypothetical protein [Stylosanthes scabra]
MSEEMKKFELPPGFRFHPTDEELITHYLTQKVLQHDDENCFYATAIIGEADFNKCEPWDLPWKGKMGEKEWYFFCLKDKKYPTGLRTNRATGAGYWKATGKDKEIYNAEALIIGMKKTLVFYKGRAPNGEKTNWVMHEYRLEGHHKHSMYNLPKTTKKEWALCRVLHKSEKKMNVPQLMDPSQVTLFSDPNNNQSDDPNPMTHEEDNDDIIVDSFETPPFLEQPYSSSSYDSSNLDTLNLNHATWDFTKNAPNSNVSNHSTQIGQEIGNYFVAQNQKSKERDFDADIFSLMYNNKEMFQMSFGNQEYYACGSLGHVDNGSLWNF